MLSLDLAIKASMFWVALAAVAGVAIAIATTQLLAFIAPLMRIQQQTMALSGFTANDAQYRHLRRLGIILTLIILFCIIVAVVGIVMAVLLGTHMLVL